MFSDDSHSERDFTVENVTLPDSPGTLLLTDRVATLSAPQLAGVLLALVRDCDAFTPGSEEATVVIAENGIELQFEHKDLRVQFHCEDSSSVTWPTVRNRLHDLPAGTEWLVIATGSLTARAKAEIDHANYRDGIHYIEVSKHSRWREY